jgi:hypothetical protein
MALFEFTNLLKSESVLSCNQKWGFLDFTKKKNPKSEELTGFFPGLTHPQLKHPSTRFIPGGWDQNAAC